MITNIELARAEPLSCLERSVLICKQRSKEIFERAIEMQFSYPAPNLFLRTVAQVPVNVAIGLIIILVEAIAVFTSLAQMEVKEAFYYAWSATVWTPLEILVSLVTALLRIESSVESWSVAESIDILFLKTKIFFYREY